MVSAIILHCMSGYGAKWSMLWSLQFLVTLTDTRAYSYIFTSISHSFLGSGNIGCHHVEINERFRESETYFDHKDQALVQTIPGALEGSTLYWPFQDIADRLGVGAEERKE